LTYFLLRVDEHESIELAAALHEMRAETRLCSVCFNITDRDQDPCVVCSDPDRDISLLCVVEEPLDVVALERTGIYQGLYHVLHGSLSPIEGVGPESLKIQELIDRVQPGEIEELILATNPTMEGEATAMFLKQHLARDDLRITRLARGLPTGSDVEYADTRTLSQALDGRRSF
jgi:recombination protein RecR